MGGTHQVLSWEKPDGKVGGEGVELYNNMFWGKTGFQKDPVFRSKAC